MERAGIKKRAPTGKRSADRLKYRYSDGMEVWERKMIETRSLPISPSVAHSERPRKCEARWYGADVDDLKKLNSKESKR
jgi:hypothetical protein